MLDMLHGVANLHRTGMGTQQIGGGSRTTLDIERVMHGTRWMILWRIQRSEVKPIGFDFRALRDIKPH